MELPFAPDALLELVTSTMADVVMVIDRDERIQYINWTAPGLTREGVRGTSMFDYMPEDQHAASDPEST